jgi:hypothetical protein
MTVAATILRQNGNAAATGAAAASMKISTDA